MDLYQRALSCFEQHFEEQPGGLFQAPGRVNLIGEHTDYNDGYVLPCAIDYQTVIAASPRSDQQVVAVAADYQEEKVSFSLQEPILFSDRYPWSNYIRGVVHTFIEQGYAVQGLNMVVAGNIPQGAGLSSSASLEVVTGIALADRAGIRISPVELAQLSQRAENNFVGCHCGIMDQMISACAEPGHAMLLDCRTLERRSVAMPDNMAVLIINSNLKRGLVESHYNLRREQCENAARYFGVKALRDVALAQVEEPGGLDPLVWRRARHVVTENARVLNAVNALAAGDLVTMGLLMADSHRSMQMDFEITTAEIDGLVDIIKNVIGEEGGVRMTGGGFGGCVVALVKASDINRVKEAVARHYPEISGGLEATTYVCQAASGAGKIEM